MNLKVMLEEAAKQYGEKTAIILGENRLSYTELDKASNRIANALTKMGVSKGDRVAILLVNSPEFAIIYFGIVKIGAIAVLLDPKYKVYELAFLFNDSKPKVLVAESPYLKPLIPVLSRFKSIKHVIDMSSEYEGHFLSYQELMGMGSEQKVAIEPEPDDLAHIAYTSGPTFQPSGVMLTHQCLIAEAVISGDGFQQTDKDMEIMFALPMHHAIGMVIILLTSLIKGSTIVMLPGLSMNSLMETIEKERVTIFMAVPFVYSLMTKMAEEEGIKHDLSSLRLCGSAGSPLSIETMVQFKHLFGISIVEYWGLTEAIAHVTCQPLDGSGKPGSVGHALPGWKVRIVNDNEKELPTNQTGEIIVNGPLMKGYYNNQKATTKVMQDGWLYTGDIGKLDKDGELFILGRKKKMIIAKGQNIYPSDIEHVLNIHPKIAEAAVIGISGELREEKAKALISLKEGEEATEQEIKQFCLEHLAKYKVPKQILFVNSLPKPATGNIYKEAFK